MTNEEKEKLMRKWSTLLESQKDYDVDGLKVKWNHKPINNDMLGNTKVSDVNTNHFDNIAFPLAKKIFAQTIGMNLVNVQPMSMEQSDEVKNEVKAINRERKIESITDDKEFEEMKVEDHPDYKGPQGKLFYMDFKYGATSSNP